jgi:valine--pyruvate aminotransferase
MAHPRSSIGTRLSRPTGALELMSDLGSIAASGSPVWMLGGGNPARIAEVEATYRRRLAQIAQSSEEFGRFAGAYGGPEGELHFRHAVAELLQREQGWPVTERNIAVTLGSQTAFFQLFNLLAGERADGTFRRILLPLAPEYIGYTGVGLEDGILESRRALVEEQDEGYFKYRVDFDALRVGPQTAALCVSRPTNPTGNVLSGDEVERLRALARASDVPMIIDAAYGMPFPGIQFTDASCVWGEDVILCLSLSKLGLPATRTGIVVAREEIVQAITAINAATALAPSSTGPVVVEPLLRDGALLDLCRRVIRPHYEAACRTATGALHEAFEGLPLRIHRPEGAFFLWLRFPGLPITSAELYRRIKARGVFVVSGHHFFPGFTGTWSHQNECLRMSYAQPEDVVRTGVRIIAEEVRRAYSDGR